MTSFLRILPPEKFLRPTNLPCISIDFEYGPMFAIIFSSEKKTLEKGSLIMHDELWQNPTLIIHYCPFLCHKEHNWQVILKLFVTFDVFLFLHTHAYDHDRIMMIKNRKHCVLLYLFSNLIFNCFILLVEFFTNDIIWVINDTYLLFNENYTCNFLYKGACWV